MDHATQRAPDPGPEPASDVVGEDAEAALPPARAHEIGNRTYLIADVDPLDVDGLRTVALGCVLWLVAFVVLLFFRGRLEEAGNGWYLWTCLAGFGLGAIGWEYCRRRRSVRRSRGETD